MTGWLISPNDEAPLTNEPRRRRVVVLQDAPPPVRNLVEVGTYPRRRPRRSPRFFCEIGGGPVVALEACNRLMEVHVLQNCFAVFPDEQADSAVSSPVAVFEYLEDAMNWGLERFKGGAFRLKYQRCVMVEEESPEIRGA